MITERLAVPLIAAAALAVVATTAGCRRDMQDQPRYEPDSASAFFPDGRADRPLVKGVVAHGTVLDDPILELGKTSSGAYVDHVPMPLTRDLLARGRQRYDVYCSPCHARTGDGNGMIVQRGYKQPPSFHIDRLRKAAPGYFFETITRGFGVMPSYATQVPVADRWAITAYVRALQLSQHATIADVPGADRARLESGAAGPAGAAPETRRLHGAGDTNAPGGVRGTAESNLPGAEPRQQGADPGRE
ncbi:MAG TPA: cytochrome c [Candidatus Binatia bacterium]|nr:cytochrome c [Candidatus Binatia bacterium]